MKRTSRYAILLLGLALVMPTFMGQAQAISVTAIHASTLSERVGAFLIILGDRSDHEFVTQIKYGGEQVYNILRGLGFPASKIYMLSPWSGGYAAHYNDSTTLPHIQYAIENWTVGKIDATHGLGIYLFDHGGGDVFCMRGSTTVDMSSSNLNSYLNIVETKTSCNRIFLIYEACESGSFINDISKTNRIICTATSDTLGSGLNPAGTWALFSEPFWGAISSGSTIGNAFISACDFVVSTGHSSSQIPWIDDNHDTVGHWVTPSHTLPSGGDGSDALDTKFTYGAPLFKISKFAFIMVQHLIVLNVSKYNYIPLWAIIQNGSKIKNVNARLIPPGWSPLKNAPPHNDSEGMWPSWENGTGVIDLPLTHGNNPVPGNYSGRYYPSLAGLQNGTWQMCYYATSDDGTRFAAGSENVTVGNGILPADQTPPTVRIDTPYDGAVVSGSIDVNASANDDQMLSSLAILVDGSVVKNVTGTNLTYPYSASYSLDTKNATHTITAIARDMAGHTASQTITVNPVDNTPLITWIIIIGCGAGVLVVVVMIEHARKQKLAKGRSS